MSSSLIESSRPSGPERPTRRHLRIASYLFVLPFLVLFLVFTVTPPILAFWNRLYSEQWTSGSASATPSPSSWVWTMTPRPSGSLHLRTGPLRVLLFGIVEVPVSLGIGLLLALLFDSSTAKLKRFFQFGYFLP